MPNDGEGVDLDLVETTRLVSELMRRCQVGVLAIDTGFWDGDDQNVLVCHKGPKEHVDLMVGVLVESV